MTDTKSLTRHKLGVTILRALNYQDEVCLIVRDPWGLLDPGSNLLQSEDSNRILKNFDDLGSPAEEKLFMAPVSIITATLSYAVVCKVRDWEEYRFRGKMVSLQNSGDSSDPTSIVASKWYYEVELAYNSDIEIILSQEDQIAPFAGQYRRYLPIAFSVFSISDNRELTLINNCDFKKVRDRVFAFSLPAGVFNIVPLCGTPAFTEENSTDGMDEFPYLDRKGNPSEKFEDTLQEVFRRFDLLGEKVLRFPNMKPILEAFDFAMNESEFVEFVSKKYERMKGGLTYNGFRAFVLKTLQEKGEKASRLFVERLGYSPSLFNRSSRLFVLTFYS